jgi:hypothetical protein
MRSTDIVRQVLDLLDEIEGPHDLKQPGEKKCGCGCGQDPCITYGTQEPEQGEPLAGRFKQIFAMLNNRDDGEYANTPNEIVSGVDSVTTLAGGGVNGPKHPDDIRVKDPRGFE